MKKLIFIGLFFFVSFCAREEIDIPEEIATLENLVVISGDQEPLYELELKRQVAFGDSEDVLIGEISTVSIDFNGNVYIGERLTNTIHVYTADGNYSGSIGREGDGPGEFRMLIDLETNDTQLAAFDLRTYKISLFEIETREIANSFIIPFTPDIRSGTFSLPTSIYLPNKDHILVSFNVADMPRESEDTEVPVLYGRLLNINTLTFEEGRIYEVPISERIVYRDDSSMRILTPKYKRKSHVLINDEFIATAWDEHLLFKFYDYDGNYKKALYYPVNKIPIDKNEIISSYDDSRELVRRLIRNDNIPDDYSAFHRAHLDDENRIWVSTYTDDLETFNWKVFTIDGDFYGSFNWPASNIFKIMNGYVYTIESDEDTGVQNVVRYTFHD